MCSAGWSAQILLVLSCAGPAVTKRPHILRRSSLTGLLTFVAWRTGGIGSFAAIWLVLMPLEAALSASRRVVTLADLSAIAADPDCWAIAAADARCLHGNLPRSA